MIRFGEDICGNLDAALSREWLETNGLGGFASSTIVGLNTRRYHGLLVAATKPPVGRYVLLSKLEETLVVDGRKFDLSANRYPGVVHPQGYQYLKQFRLNPFPVSTYEVNGIQVEKTVFMIHGENSTVVQYELKKMRGVFPHAVSLEVRPLMAFRDYHSTTHENDGLNSTLDVGAEVVAFAPYSGLPILYVAHNGAQIEKTGVWYRNFEFDRERERGLDFMEDLFQPYELRFDLMANPKADLIASTEQRDARSVTEYRATEVARRRKMLASAPADDDFVRALTVAADQFIVKRGEQKTVIAGYPWFSDWGRDTMISLPGLTLPTGNFGVARSILKTFAEHVDQGMLPNRFPDAGEAPEYNTVDATLWFFEAIRAYVAYTDDLEFVREVYPTLNDIISWHVKGTRYGIKLDPSGLLSSGAPGVQLTWMDAKVGDWVVTPRRGKPVEVQALWFNALCVMEEFARRFDDVNNQKRFRSMSTLTQWSFNRLFWNETSNYLYDVINGGPPDASIRPNQIFAASLHHSMLTQERAKLVVEKVREHLLTPYGLRSLSPSDPNYKGRYAGDPLSRDSAYHQGTVWPWLMGPFLSAYLRIHNASEEARKQALEWIRPLKEYSSEAGLGQIPEVFDGDPPHRAGGCIAQAWSVSELLRVLSEALLPLRMRDDDPKTSILLAASSTNLSKNASTALQRR